MFWPRKRVKGCGADAVAGRLETLLVSAQSIWRGDAAAHKNAINEKQEDSMSASSQQQGANVAPSAAFAANSLAALRVVPTGAALGAEIRGIDLSLPVPDDVKAALRDAWAKHSVLLWRDQHIDDDQLLATAAIFGPPQEGAAASYLIKAGHDPANRFLFAENPAIGIISNLDANGQPVVENEGLGSQEVVWHSDNSYVAMPPAGSMLYSLEVPVNGGGDTSFNNQYLAYEELPDDIKQAIKGKVQVHDTSRNSAGRLRPTAKLPTRPEEVEGPTHPLVRIHPVSRRPALYLGRRRVWPSNYIVGLSSDESEALLDKLWTHATQPKYEWTHIWKVGDLLLWDNRCCMHYRTEIDVKQRRIMHRTVIKGEAVIAA